MTSIAQTEDFVGAPRRHSLLVRFATAQPLGMAGLVVVALMVFAAVFSEFIAPYDPLAVEFGAQLQSPSFIHLLGTDGFGRDIFSRLVFGARTAMAVGFISAFVGCSIGALIGIISAYYGGRIDLIIQRFIDILLAFPIIVLALVVIAVMQKTPVLGVDVNVIVAIAIPFIPKVARVTRSAALSIVTLPFIDAARAAGYSRTRIVLRHIMPNVTAPYLIMLTAFIGQAILLEASLSFLGLGVSEPTAAWGLMLSGNNTDYYKQAPWMIVFPGLAISLSVFAFNLLGDALRDWLDPKLKI